jgi:uncharacterized protein (DUF4415 family)
MKNKDIDKEIDAELKKRGFRRLSPEELPKAIRNLRGSGKKVQLRDCKSRITIYLDADIVEHFKQQSDENGKGYQTLINDALRNLVDNENAVGKFDEILEDKEFLSKLKTELETV